MFVAETPERDLVMAWRALAVTATAALMCAWLAGCHKAWTPPPRLVSQGQAERLKVHIDGPPKIFVLASECAEFVDQAATLYEAAVRTELERAGFVVVGANDEPHLVAELKGGLEQCWGKEGGQLELFNGKFLAKLKRPGSDQAVASSARQSGRELFNVVPQQLVSDLLGSRDVAQLADAQAGPAAPAAPSQVAAREPPASAPVVDTSAFKPGTPQPGAFALVIGVESYRDYPAPSGARSDAHAFAALAQKTLGVPADNVRLLIDGRATRTSIMKEVQWLKKNVTPQSRVYFFFSGHGAPDPTSGVAYLLPSDGDAAALDVTGVKLDEMMRKLADTGATEVVAFVDSCFSGSGGRSVLPKGVRPLVRVKQAQPAGKVSMFAAASGDEIAGPARDGNNGLFTHFVLEGLGSGAADIDGDGSVTAEELASWVTPRVEREAKRDSRAQTPHLVGPGSASITSGLR